MDMVNAFNTLFWSTITRAIARNKASPYQRKDIQNYLSDRAVTYSTAEGKLQSWKMNHGVPQGSVHGPIPWKICFNQVLETVMPVGVHVVCYTDDNQTPRRQGLDTNVDGISRCSQYELPTSGLGGHFEKGRGHKVPRPRPVQIPIPYMASHQE